MFGRIAAGLVHDLSHPIQNIGNSTRLLLRDDLDAESRELFQRTIERELATLKRFMDDLRNVVKPKPIERFALDVNASVAEIVESMRAEGERARRHGRRRATRTDRSIIDGDRFALGRVYRNLITNAIQATEPGGRVDDRRPARAGDHVEISVTDTGSGIPRRPAGGDLRRLRHDQAPRPRARPGDLEAHRRAARRHHHRRERSRTRHRVHAAFSGAATTARRRRRQAERRPQPGTTMEDDMFRTLVKTDALAVEDQDVRGAVLRAAHAARAAALQRGDPARPRATGSSSTTTR